MSVLVHEMVHHLQNAPVSLRVSAGGRTARLSGAGQVAELFGRTWRRIFEIDPFTLLVTTRCEGLCRSWPGDPQRRASTQTQLSAPRPLRTASSAAR
jgi:hypothetical protein